MKVFCAADVAAIHVVPSWKIAVSSRKQERVSPLVAEKDVELRPCLRCQPDVVQICRDADLDYVCIWRVYQVCASLISWPNQSFELLFASQSCLVYLRPPDRGPVKDFVLTIAGSSLPRRSPSERF